MIQKWLFERGIFLDWVNQFYSNRYKMENPVKDLQRERMKNLRFVEASDKFRKEIFHFRSACTSFPVYPTPFSLDPVIL